MAHGLAFSSLAALAPRMLVLRISRRSLSLAPRNAIKSPVFYYLGSGSRFNSRVVKWLPGAADIADAAAAGGGPGTPSGI